MAAAYIDLAWRWFANMARTLAMVFTVLYMALALAI